MNHFPSPIADQWLGEYQLGDHLDLALAAVTNAMVASNPSSSPVFAVYNGAGDKVASGVLPRKDQATTGWFQRGYPLTTSGWAAGVYTVHATYVVSSQTRCCLSRFRLLAGGDADGQVIGVVDHDRPEVHHLVYETQSGKIIDGRNPRPVANP